MRGILENLELFENVKILYNTLVSVSTGTSYNDPVIVSNFENSRKFIINNRIISDLIPDYVKKYRDLPSYWGYIKNISKTYEGRRLHLSDTFERLFDYFDRPAAIDPTETLSLNQEKLSSGYVQELWEKAVSRLETDPEGAITASRTVIEATCKFILEKKAIPINGNPDLTNLFKMTANSLSLAPGAKTKNSINQIYSGAISVINGVASLRNQGSDSHAITDTSERLSTRHATLCVNMAGTIAFFLISSFENSCSDETLIHE